MWSCSWLVVKSDRVSSLERSYVRTEQDLGEKKTLVSRPPEGPLGSVDEKHGLSILSKFT